MSLFPYSFPYCVCQDVSQLCACVRIQLLHVATNLYIWSHREIVNPTMAKA